MRLTAISLTLFILTLSTQAHALPEWSYQKLKGWVEKHSFLTPRLLRVDDHTFYATRTIKGGFVVRVEFKGQSQNEKKYLTQTNLTLESGEETKNIWIKNHEAGKLILKNIFGKEFIEDYSTSQFQYSGIEYMLKTDKVYNREKIASIHAGLDNRQPAFKIVPWGRSSFYKGDIYGYEIFEKFNSSKRDLFEFRIYPLNKINEQIGIIENNLKMFQELEQWNKRFQPAEIKIE